MWIALLNKIHCSLLGGDIIGLLALKFWCSHSSIITLLGSNWRISVQLMCGNLNTMTCPDIRVSCLVNKLVWFGFVLFFILSFVDMYIYFLLARNQSVPLPPCLQAAYVHSDHVCEPITACWGGCFAKCWHWNTETRPCSLMCCLNGIRIAWWLRVGRG